MIKIGDFARLGQVSVVTLRHYDDIGLLKPVQVDHFTGYRYYTVAQLADLNQILALKDLGFSLEQIEHIRSGLSSEQLRGMLKLKQAEVQQLVAEEQARLLRIVGRLKQIEMEKNMQHYTVKLKSVPSQLIASCKVTIPTNNQAPEYIGEAFGQVYQHIQTEGAAQTGTPFSIWHQPASIFANEVMETALPISQLVPSSERVKVYELPAVHVAAAVHQGPFESLVQLHATLLDWIETQGYQIVGHYREIYTNHMGDMSSAQTEVQYPVSKATE